MRKIITWAVVGRRVSFLVALLVGSLLPSADAGRVATSIAGAVDGDFTASFTFRWNGFAPIPKVQAWRNGMIASHRSGYYEGWRLLLHDANEGRPVFEIGRKEGAVSVESGEGLSTGVWHRVAISWQAKAGDPSVGTMRLFADGALMAESPSDRPRPLVDSSPVMLDYVDYGVGALKLEVADCSLVPRALSEAEIVAEYHADSTIAADDPLAGRPLMRQLVTRAERQIAESARRREALLREGAPRCAGGRADADLPLEVRDGPVELTVPAGETTVIENIRFRGRSLHLASKDFEPVRDPSVSARFPARIRDRVRVASVPGLADFVPYGVGVNERKAIFVLADGVRPLPMAAWPGSSDLAQATAKEGVIRFETPAAPQLAPGRKALAYGYWRYYWADAALPVEALEAGGYKLLQSHNYGLGERPRLVIAGVPEVMSKPGDWCIVDERLYLLPPVDGFDHLSIPQFRGPFFRARGQRGRIVFRNVSFEGSLDTALELVDCADVSLEHVSFRNNCGDDAVIRGCRRARVVDSSFANTGLTQLRLNGGDRETLTPGEMLVEACRFERCGLVQRTYTPCILLEGCGGIVSNCRFSDTPSSAMRIEGNDHTVRDCRFERNVLRSDDQGAVDIWGNPTYRGNLFYRNLFTDIGGDGNHDCGRNGIRFDDFISGMAVVSNTFVNAAQGGFGAVNMNGGHYNLIQGNCFRNCSLGIGGYGWGDEAMAKRLSVDEQQRNLAILGRHPAYRDRYPELQRLGTDDAAQLVLGNRFEGCEKRLRHMKLSSIVAHP